MHVWKDYNTAYPKLVTAWRALTDMLPSSRSKSHILWMVGGDIPVLNIVGMVGG